MANIGQPQMPCQNISFTSARCYYRLIIVRFLICNHSSKSTPTHRPRCSSPSLSPVAPPAAADPPPAPSSHHRRAGPRGGPAAAAQHPGLPGSCAAEATATDGPWHLLLAARRAKIPRCPGEVGKKTI